MMLVFCTVACRHWRFCCCWWICDGHWQGFHRNFTCCSLWSVASWLAVDISLCIIDWCYVIYFTVVCYCSIMHAYDVGNISTTCTVLGYEPPRFLSYTCDNWLTRPRIEIELKINEDSARYPTTVIWREFSRRRSYFFNVRLVWFVCTTWTIVCVVRSTQPCIPPGSLNRVPASAGVKAGKSPLPGGR